ncbi:MAG: hypothetical protein CYPHOPRED_003434 [Cyphobasidiales sp. Tagirdzhanova-0007]|nr:MAG: hypothetical protein CYPHOPRED_003434 [Cyphobasidiales sp. Tagirdzhanova-0007]
MATRNSLKLIHCITILLSLVLPHYRSVSIGTTITIILSVNGRVAEPPQDTHDLFATLVVSLKLSNNTRFFRTYPNTFTTDDAAQNLSSLRFSQSNRSSDPNDPQRIITTTTTTTFTMTRDIAKGICQQFMDARLIENAIDPAAPVFKDRGIFSITPKGLHVLERFITKNGIAADHLVKVFTTQQICMRLLHLERRPADDDIIVTRPVLQVVFKRFVGTKSPNYTIDTAEVAQAAAAGQTRPFAESVRPPAKFERGSGVEMQDMAEKLRNGGVVVVKHVFSSAGAIDWLCDHSTCCCRDEAAELLAHFVRYGFIALYLDKARSESSTTSQSKSAEAGLASTEAEFRWGPRIIYNVTDEGRQSANWDGLNTKPASVTGMPASAPRKKSSESAADEVDGSAGSVFGAPISTYGSGSLRILNGVGGVSTAGGGLGDMVSSGDTSGRGAFSGSGMGGEWSLAGGMGVGSMLDSKLLTKMTLKEIFEVDLSDDSAWNKEGQHSSTTRLRAILEDIRLRAVFRDYLKNNYCEENLGFWLDVQDFRRRFSTTSSAIGGAPTGPGSSSSSSPHGQAYHHHAEKDKPRKPLLRGVTSFGSTSSSSPNLSGNSSNNNSSSSSSPSTTAAAGAGANTSGAASNAMEAHQNDLNIAAVNIYRLYLAPQSPSELNIDHNLRADVVNFIQKCADEASISLSALSASRSAAAATSSVNIHHPAALSSSPPVGAPGLSGASSPAQPPHGQQSQGQGQGPGQGPSTDASPDTDLPDSAGQMERRMILPLRATQVQTLLRYYERIQDHIFRLLATDQVPKFIRTPEFLKLLKSGNSAEYKSQLQ